MASRSYKSDVFLSAFLSHRNLFLIFILAVAVTNLSCASTGPKITREDRRQIEEEFNMKFLAASDQWLERVYRVGYKLLSSYVPGHGDTEPKFGFVGVGVDELEKYARKVYGINRAVKGVLVRGLYPGSKAESLDLRAGDVITKLDRKKIKSLGKYFKVIRSAKTPYLKAEVWRQGEVLLRDLPVEKVYYNAQFFLAPTPDVEATAAYSKIRIGIGAIRYCRNDDELAVIMGHELAHTTLKHSLKEVGIDVASSVTYGAAATVVNFFTFPGVGNLIVTPIQNATNALVSRRYEREADYFGMQHAFHGGYEVEHGSRVFSRLATDSPGYNILAYTFSSHPETSERFLRFEKIIEELKALYPDKAVMPSNPDWEITVPLEPGETLTEALDRLVQSETPSVVPRAA